MQAISSHFKEVIIKRKAIFVVLMVALSLPIALDLFAQEHRYNILYHSGLIPFFLLPHRPNLGGDLRLEHGGFYLPRHPLFHWRRWAF